MRGSTGFYSRAARNQTVSSPSSCVIHVLEDQQRFSTIKSMNYLLFLVSRTQNCIYLLYSAAPSVKDRLVYRQVCSSSQSASDSHLISFSDQLLRIPNSRVLHHLPKPIEVYTVCNSKSLPSTEGETSLLCPYQQVSINRCYFSHRSR